MNTAEYHKLAQLEDRHWYFLSLHRHIGRALDQALPAGESRPARLLDAGCGTGGLIRRIAPRRPAWQWSAVDLSPLACELATARAGRLASIAQASATGLPFPADSFDAVVSADVLAHVDDDARALAEAFRVLKPGGVAVVNVPAYPWLWSYHDEQVQARRRYTARGLGELLAAAGFRGIQSTHWNALLFPAIWARRKLLRPSAGGSDVGPVWPPLNLALRALMRLEHAWVDGGGRWAWGSSILVTARKPLAADSPEL